jgi:hypothetical protein
VEWLNRNLVRSSLDRGRAEGADGVPPSFGVAAASHSSSFTLLGQLLRKSEGAGCRWSDVN